ncbi:MAG TPA: hypothetical protein VL201_03350 [Patescibacteria group bacterium]|jgi:hypothetical protein|nr:hypothetical protein [Patescibacteria group bacterium]
MKNKVLLYAMLFYGGTDLAMFVPIPMSVPIPMLPGNAQMITMQKTVVNNQLYSIDVLFGNDKKEYFFWQYYLSNPNLIPSILQTNVTYITDSINDNQTRIMAIKGQYAHNLFSEDVQPLHVFHNTFITKMKHDTSYMASQSSAQNIRFWPKSELQFVPNQKTIKDIIAKEISNAYLLDYVEGNAIWAKRDFITGTMLNVYAGFEFSHQGKSRLFKKDIYDFKKTKQIFSIPFVHGGYMPACFLEKEYALLFNEYKKEILIITYEKTKPQEQPTIELTPSHGIEKKSPAKRVDKEIKISSIQLKNIKHSSSDGNPLEILYRVPKKIDYNAADKSFLLIYDDRVIKCKWKNNKYTYKIILDRNNANFYIVDTIIYNHKSLYALFYNQYEKRYYLFMSDIS